MGVESGALWWCAVLICAINKNIERLRTMNNQEQAVVKNSNDFVEISFCASRYLLAEMSQGKTPKATGREVFNEQVPLPVGYTSQTVLAYKQAAIMVGTAYADKRAIEQEQELAKGEKEKQEEWQARTSKDALTRLPSFKLSLEDWPAILKEAESKGKELVNKVTGDSKGRAAALKESLAKANAELEARNKELEELRAMLAKVQG